MNGYVVIYERSEDGGWGAYCPDIPEVIAVGTSRPEVEARMKEALSAYFEYLRETGEPIPEPASDAGFVAV